jgi:AcrR family transcriptional regulator
MRDGGMMSFEIKIRDGSFRISLGLNGTKRAGIPADGAGGRAGGRVSADRRTTGKGEVVKAGGAGKPAGDGAASAARPGGQSAGPAGKPGGDGAAPQRGRPRSEQADRAIMAAALELLAERGIAGMSIEEVASRAGVGKATIYRRWSSKGALALDAFLAEFRQQQPLPDTGSLRGDLRASLRAWVRAVTHTPVGRILADLIGEAQHDKDLAVSYRERVLEPLRQQHRIMLDRAIARGEIPADTDREVALDLMFGAAQHRLLLGHLPLTERFVRQVVDVIVAGLQTPLPS